MSSAFFCLKLNISMDLIEDKDNKELIQSLIAEQAKATRELKCAQADIAKVKNRLSFTLLVLNKLIERED